jgi:predicted nucleic acid-binding protein
MPKPRARYWDAGPFIAWLKQETRDDRVSRCEPVIRAAEKGQMLLVTSAIALVEVVKLDEKGARVNIGSEAEAKISGFFRQPYISVRDYDFRTADLSRRLIWDYDLSTRDAIHAATALRWRLTQLDTFDGGLLALDGKLGSPILRITVPDLPQQLELAFSAEPVTEDDEGPE